MRMRSTFRRIGLLTGMLAIVFVSFGSSGAMASAGPSIAIQPSAGPPGTRVTIRGTVPGMTAKQHSAPVFTVCMNGCVDGFTSSGTSIHWTGTNTFVAHFTIPKVPMLTPSGVLMPRDGTIRIGVTCVEPTIRGCAGTTQASVPFRIVLAPKPVLCTGHQSCGEIRLSAQGLYPGELVHISGWAPLTQLIGTPFPYSIELSRGTQMATVGQIQQQMNGDLSGTFRVPAIASGLGDSQRGKYVVSLQYQFNIAPKKVPKAANGIVYHQFPHAKSVYGYEIVDLATKPLKLRSLPTWSTLGRLPVRQVVYSQPMAFTAGSADVYAYCVPNGIEITRNGGSSWSEIPTDGAATASMKTAFPIAYNTRTPMPDTTCQSVTLDPNVPGTIYASFLAISRKFGSAPPFFQVLYETRNGGATWEPVPPPRGYTNGNFGGLWIRAAGPSSTVVAFYSHIPTSNRTEHTQERRHITAIATADGGATWTKVPIGCPVGRPCVQFGALPGGLPGMGGSTTQPLLRSTNGGQTFNALGWPSGYNYPQGLLSGLAAIVWLGGQDIAFISPLSQYQLRISHNGGRSWQAIMLPPLPAKNPIDYNNSPYADLMMLPDGTLLAAPSGQYGSGAQGYLWYTLAPGATQWHQDTAVGAPTTDPALLVVGPRLVWPAFGANGLPATSPPGLQTAPLP